MKFAFSTNAFRKFSFSQAASAISNAGYQGIEIMCDTPHAFPDELSGTDIGKIKETVNRNQLEISNLNAFMMCAVKDFHHPSWIEPDEDFRKIRVQYTKDCIDLAVQLGAKTISTEPGGPIKDIADGTQRQAALHMFAKGLNEVLSYAKEKGIQVLVEPEPDLLIQTSDEFLWFARMIDHPNLGLNFDIGHFFCVGEDPVQTIIKLQNHTCHYHLEDIPHDRTHQHIMPGQGGIDIATILKAIEQTGYKDFITVELYPYLEDPEKAAMEARNYIKDTCNYG